MPAPARIGIFVNMGAIKPGQAVAVFREAPGIWRQIQAAGMERDFSWDRSAEVYEALFARISAT